MSPDDVRRIALSLAGTRETGEPGRPAFAVRGRVFATLWTPSRLFVNDTLLELTGADEAAVRRAIERAWAEAAPRKVRRAHLQP